MATEAEEERNLGAQAERGLEIELVVMPGAEERNQGAQAERSLEIELVVMPGDRATADMVDMAGAQRGLEHNLDGACRLEHEFARAWSTGVLVGACRLDPCLAMDPDDCRIYW
jgi:hypothetical protein